MRVESYLQGDWCDGGGEGETYCDPTTGDVVAQFSTQGLNLAEAFQYARTTGCSNLAATTIHQRASMLKALAKILGDAKESLYEVSYQTGATKADSWIDIDGGFGTLFTYASRATNELPNAKVVVDGDVEKLSRDGSFVAQHVFTPRQGVALQINAFNFPIWGTLEKFAPAFIAGMPVIVKAAEQTGFLTAALVRVMIDADVLPEGALQLVCGKSHDILDHVQSQDVIAFTGSTSTARIIRTHPQVVAHNPRLSIETDSVNATILGPDAKSGSDEFNLLIDEVVKEISTKAGQKCTAIRRILVPLEIMDELSASLSIRLQGIVTGNPRNERVQMGPLVSLAAKDRVASCIEALVQSCDVVLDGRTIDDLVDAERSGAFIGPTLLQATSSTADVVNNVEAFGPVCTLIGYSDNIDLVRIVKAGDGALVGSIFSNDDEFVASLVNNIASYHGRILVVNGENAQSHTGHGSPLPTLLHGGPGRAGDGEELGGMRAVKHYMQRTAIQGSPQTLANVTGRWVEGAEIIEPGVHPFRIPFHELAIGTTFFSAEREVTIADIESFAHLTGDIFYAHMDEESAKRNPIFGGRVAHGYFLVSAAAGLFVDPPYGPVLANYGIDALRFTKPVKPGTRIKVRLTCKSKSFRQGRGYGEVAWDTQITDQDDNVCASYDVLTMVSELAIPDGGET
ncbi:MAG: phenylacetic acid degradation bifunctional protein PaaZ [Gammaproteobacteria bacterium]|nr:phenylacetic acid degradation bifunctional protein PaaZ [Gammaproteobacteria bacterium]